MRKPWHPYEQNFINHPKFLVLSAGAVCLWLEGKNYCDVHMTDGMIPREALRTFRFNSRTRVDELQATVEGYNGPLWEDHATGFKMRDYLNHNPCRDEVLARIAYAEAAKAGEQEVTRQRMHRWREAKKAKRGDALGDGHNDRNNDRNTTVTTTVTPALHDRNNDRNNDRNTTVTLRSRYGLSRNIVEEEEEVPPPPPNARSKRPLFTGQRFTVFEWQVDDLTRMLGSHTEAFDLHAWFFDLDAQAVKAGQVIPQRDGGQWLQAQLLAECARRKLPMFDAPTRGKPEPTSTVPDVARTAEYLRQQREL